MKTDKHLTSYLGEIIDNPSLKQLAEALQELQTAQDEATDIWLSDDNGWYISYFATGLVTFAKADNSAFYQMEAVSIEKVLELWQLLLEGAIDALKQEKWT